MWPFSRKSSPVLEQKQSRGYTLHYDQWSPVSWTKPEYEAFAKEAYAFNVIAFSAINRISSAISAIQWRVDSDGKMQTKHPLLDLLARPNPKMSSSVWWQHRIGYLMLDGNDFLERRVEGRAIELWPLRPDRMEILKATTGLPGGYVYKVGNKSVKFSADPITGESDILHTKLFNPLDDWRGMAPIQAAAHSVDQHNEATNWVQKLLQNAARPSGALVVDKETSLSDDEFDRLKSEIETKYSGSSNAGRPMLLEGGLDWKAMGLSPMDMEILRTKESAARDISLAFGVPPLLLNIPGDNTYANYREARLGFYEDTLLPLLNFLTAELNQWLSPLYDNAKLVPNLDAIEAIAEKRTRVWELADNSDDITLNESRAMKGFPPLPAPLGDTLMAEIRSAVKPAKEAEEEAMEEEVGKMLKEMGYGR